MLISSFIHVTMFLTTNVKAVTYGLDIDEDDSFEWEVTDLNPHQFEKVFDFKPSFEKGDKAKRTIERIDDTADGWTLVVEFWDFKIDRDENGTIIYEAIPDSPGDFDENIFIPTPVNDFLSEAVKDLGSEYSVQGSIVEKLEKDFTMIKEYDARGVLMSEEYVDDDGIVLVKIEGTFRVIPAANVEIILSVMAFAIAGIIFVIVKNKKCKLKIS